MECAVYGKSDKRDSFGVTVFVRRARCGDACINSAIRGELPSADDGRFGERDGTERLE